MKITIHRGLNQIGGCITEISSQDTSILIDLGQNLPDNKGLVKDSFQSKEAVSELCKNVDAIFYTHYHGDHIGLMNLVPSGIDQYIGVEAKKVMMVKSKYLRQDLNKISALKTFSKLDRVSVGDIIITPFLVSHSACDSYMFLIEVEGMKILHTGDFRDHGYLGKGLIPTIRKYIGQVDYLITEGTMLSRKTESVPSEYDLQVKAKELMKRFKYVFILGSSTDLDRLATFHKAKPKKHLFVCDTYQSEVLDVFTDNSGSYSDLYKFENLNTFPDPTLKLKMIDKGFAMMVRCNGYESQYGRFTNLMIDSIPQSDRLLIYSMWSGYINDSVHQKYEYIEFISKFQNIETIHTSGHASMQCLAEVCNLTKPKFGILPIHSEESNNYSNINISSELKERIITSTTQIGTTIIEIL